MRAFLCLVRAALELVATLVYTLAMEVVLRFWVLPRFRKDEVGRARAVSRVARLWGTAVYRTGHHLLAARLIVEGSPESAGRCIVVANHQSSIDIPLLLCLFRNADLKFVAVDGWRYGKPGISLALRHGGCAFLGNGGLGSDLAELRRFGERMEHLQGTPVIFPDGTRTQDGSLRPFRVAGIEAVRHASRLPLLPVVLDGLWKSRTVRDLFDIVGTRVWVRVGEPVSFEEVEGDPRKAYEGIEEWMRRNLDEMRRSEPGPSGSS